MGTILIAIIVQFVALVEILVVEPIKKVRCWKVLSNLSKIILAAMPVTIFFMISSFIYFKKSFAEFNNKNTLGSESNQIVGFTFIVFIISVSLYIFFNIYLTKRYNREDRQQVLFYKNTALFSLQKKQKILENEISQLENDLLQKYATINFIRLIDNCCAQSDWLQCYYDIDHNKYSKTCNIIKKKTVELEKTKRKIHSTERDIKNLNSRR